MDPLAITQYGNLSYTFRSFFLYKCCSLRRIKWQYPCNNWQFTSYVWCLLIRENTFSLFWDCWVYRISVTFFVSIFLFTPLPYQRHLFHVYCLPTYRDGIHPEFIWLLFDYIRWIEKHLQQIGLIGLIRFAIYRSVFIERRWKRCYEGILIMDN